MPLTAGTRIGPYEIVTPLGAGGMGEVYRARDSRLNRDVAIKILPSEFSSDPARMARFQREAQVLAALNHPNIAAIYGLEGSGGALVMELVEGQTLAERINRGSIGMDEALAIARQIADGLEAAHERGIVHRDLKPSNLKITPDGKVKVLDFGLAKDLTPANISDQSQLPTVTEAGSRAGTILGTAAYMSPEQACGLAVDRRSDVWAFGCVLYEMLTAHRAFAGQTSVETLAAVMRADPDWSKLPAETSDSIRRLLRRCLEKDPKRRLRDIADVRLELDESHSDSRLVAQAEPQKQVLPWGVAAVAILIAAAVTWSGWEGRNSQSRRTTHLEFALPPGEQYMSTIASPGVAISPDGSKAAFVSGNGGNRRIYLREIGQTGSQPIAGTEAGIAPFFSPDGRWIGFGARGKLKKVSLSGGAASNICDATDVRGAFWAPGDMIYFSPEFWAGVYRVPAAGGTPQEVTKPDTQKGERSHWYPEVLPDGRAVLFTIRSSDHETFDDARIGLQMLDTGERKIILEGGNAARYASSGHLVYTRDGALMAAPFDLKELRVTGPATRVLERVLADSANGPAHFALSNEGTLLYAAGRSHASARELLWVDLKGNVQPTAAPPRGYLYASVTPDSRSLLLEIAGANHDLWMYDLNRGVLTRLTVDGDSHQPISTPDGNRITFRAGRVPGMNLFSMPIDGGGTPERLSQSPNMQAPHSWSAKHQTLAFVESHPQTGTDIWITKAGQDPKALFRTAFREDSPRFSPDGNWLAYSSSSSGRDEIYVQRFPGMGERAQLSTAGGTWPMWTPGGSELYYREANRVMGVSLSTTGRLAAGKPRTLFEGSYVAIELAPDGKRFIAIKEDQRESTPAQMNIALNWFEELKRKANH